MPPPACKVFRWIRKAGDATICRRPRLDDDNNSIISSNREYSHTTGRHKPSHNFIRHDTGEREIWRNKVGGDFSPTNSLKDRTGRKKHKSLPIPPKKSSTSNNEEGSSNIKMGGGIVVDTRRFCMVDPFNLGGHRRSYTLDTTWNITAFFDNNTGEIKDDESPATILIAKKENLARNSRFSVQPTRRNNSKKRSIAKEIREVEVRTFRWETRHINREKTCSQLYELYENQINNSLLNSNIINDIQDKPLPPIPNDENQNKNFTNYVEDSDIILDPELQSIIDTISLISDYNNDDAFVDNSSIYTTTSTARESFSDLLITEEVMLDLIEDENSTPSINRDSINSFETLPVDVETCLSCKRRSIDSGYSIQWCKSCEMKRFEEQFESWSSGNDDIDCFILETQLNSTSLLDHLDWISYDRFQDIELFSTGDNECTFRAIWLDGPNNIWDMKNNRYVGSGECLVVLKCIEIPQNSPLSFFDQLSKNLRCENNSGAHIVRCYGITQDPKSEKYMLVLQYAKDGNISHYLKQNSDITWQKRLEILYALAEGLYNIHEKNLVHGNLHSGNVLLDDSLTLISDLGMSRYPISSNDDNRVYGILPFIAPELLKNKPYTMASDIYSFGTIMWELITGKAPFADRAHDEKFAKEICERGLRPEIPTDIPECYVKLLRQCWSPNPFKRPCANVLRETLSEWIKEISSNSSSEISTQFQQSEGKRLEILSTTKSQLEKRIDERVNDLNIFIFLKQKKNLAEKVTMIQ
ncbi:kinase-like domain-containing protein [Glomus cerebriforme]|uniref:Kinase-like domain-containing protein n=1 Tax=Glomus cerebriforme TaxID=658196 RepID=A0A397T7I1_9GLOM|nr:kinase-like domain-containing protein [Glomus cerebriforme]